MLTLEGRDGEGGGQVLRSSLSLAAALGRPFRIANIRAGRSRPGLMRQHLTAVRAAAEVCDGVVRGAELGSTELEFEPGALRAGDYCFAVGSAGSALLVLQTVLPPLLRAAGESSVVVEGGTHNPWAPPFEALARSFAPLLARTGVRLDLTLDRPGFYPAGGGRVRARIVPARRAEPLELVERGAERSRRAEALLAHLPDVVGRRELEALGKRQPWVRERGELVRMDESAGPGNLVHVTLAFEEVTEVFTGFGEKGVRAEDIGKRLGTEVALYLAHGAPVGEHLADQLMVPLCLLAGGRYRASALSGHATTNAAVIDAFLPGAVRTEVDADAGATVSVASA